MRPSDLLRDLLEPAPPATPATPATKPASTTFRAVRQGCDICDGGGDLSQKSQGVANAESEQPGELSQKSQVSQGGTTAAPTEPCPACDCRHYWYDDSGWRCEGCNPPAPDASRFLTVSGGKTAPMRKPAVPWPAELSIALRRVSTAFEWSDADRRDFMAWARRSAQGLSDARVFLEAEMAKLPIPGLDDRRRVVLDRLEADAAARVAWLASDDGQSTEVLLTLAVRGRGTIELAVPRATFDALAIPQLIEGIAAKGDL